MWTARTRLNRRTRPRAENYESQSRKGAFRTSGDHRLAHTFLWGDSYGEDVNADKAACPRALCIIQTPDQVEPIAAHHADQSFYSVVTVLDSYGPGSAKRGDRVHLRNGQAALCAGQGVLDAHRHTSDAATFCAGGGAAGED
ncbi:MAG: hypothetical protein OHK0018_08950 [Erythrobacter tepidarius]